MPFPASSPPGTDLVFWDALPLASRIGPENNPVAAQTAPVALPLSVLSQVQARCLPVPGGFVAGPGSLRGRSSAFLFQVMACCVAGLGPFCCRSAFFPEPATQIGLSAPPVFQVGRFLRTCCGTERDLQHNCPIPAAEQSGTCNTTARDLLRNVIPDFG